MTEEQKAVLEAIRDELSYRREKQWKVFSWSATLQIAAVGGIITLVGQKQFVFPYWPQRFMIAAALVALGAYACLWISENIKFEGHARTALLNMLKEHGLSDQVIPDPNVAPVFGYSATIILLVIAAILILFFSPCQ